MRIPNKAPRRAHCVGCGVTFNQMHLMINHRRHDRCGGRFLPPKERELLMTAKMLFNDYTNGGDPDDYRAMRNALIGFNDMRKRRHTIQFGGHSGH